ncbi:MAG: helix-turn-helix domain-containing protein [Motilibacteraceae bacterium]
MYDHETRSQAMKLLADGLSLNAASKRLGISRAALRDWRDGVSRRQSTAPSECPRCTGRPLDTAAYAHLLGLYLGDGCLSAMPKGCFVLRVACADAYPRLIAECSASIRAVRPGTRVWQVAAPGCTHVTASWKHWPCLFPQHGPGRKHERAISLERWQEEIVHQHPKEFLRGLFHSDGCRVVNWTTKHVDEADRRYEYPRWFFTNESKDVLQLCGWALDLVGVPYRTPRPNLLSVARREGVAALDDFVGPKS